MYCKVVTATVSPLETVKFPAAKFSSVPDVATDPWMTYVAPVDCSEKPPIVPPAALVSLVIACADACPPAVWPAVTNAVAVSVRVAIDVPRLVADPVVRTIRYPGDPVLSALATMLVMTLRSAAL